VIFQNQEDVEMNKQEFVRLMSNGRAKRFQLFILVGIVLIFYGHLEGPLLWGSIGQGFVFAGMFGLVFMLTGLYKPD
jgi:hypothetical protein